MIQKWIKNKKQKTKKKTEAFSEDVRLVFNNCRTYNAPGTDVYNAANAIEKIFDQKFPKIIKDAVIF